MDSRGTPARIDVFGRLLGFLNRLDAAHVHYTLGQTRPDSVMVDIALPGWRWEADAAEGEKLIRLALHIELLQRALSAET